MNKKTFINEFYLQKYRLNWQRQEEKANKT